MTWEKSTREDSWKRQRDDTSFHQKLRSVSVTIIIIEIATYRWKSTTMMTLTWWCRWHCKIWKRRKTKRIKRLVRVASKRAMREQAVRWPFLMQTRDSSTLKDLNIASRTLIPKEPAAWSLINHQWLLKQTYSSIYHKSSLMYLSLSSKNSKVLHLTDNSKLINTTMQMSWWSAGKWYNQRIRVQYQKSHVKNGVRLKARDKIISHFLRTFKKWTQAIHQRQGLPGVKHFHQKRIQEV